MLTLLTALALQAPATTAAPAPLPACPAIPLALAAWDKSGPANGALTIGSAANLTPVAVATVRLAVQPSRPLSGSHLATVGFRITKAGRYTVAAGGTSQPIRPLWLDIAGTDGKPLKSVAHRHGPECSSITKLVEFDLQPGKYTFLATGLTNADPVRVLIMPNR